MPLRLQAPNGNNSSDSASSLSEPETAGESAEADAIHPAVTVSPRGRPPITREIAPEPVLGDRNGAEETPEASERDLPAFAQTKPKRRWRALKAAAWLGLGLAAGGAGYQTRDYWLPQVIAKARAVLPREPDAYLSLSVSDDNGQLRIQWDRNAPAIRGAVEATIEITDGYNVPRAVRLDGAHLAAGVFNYVRQNERVDVTLIASEPSGQQVKEQTSFLGRLPLKAEDPVVHKERDAEASERAEKLQKDVNFQAAKIHKMEKDLKDMRDELQQRRRADNHTPDSGKKK